MKVFIVGDPMKYYKVVLIPMDYSWLFYFTQLFNTH